MIHVDRPRPQEQTSPPPAPPAPATNDTAAAAEAAYKAEVKSYFKAFDANHDGEVTFEEVESWATAHGQPPPNGFMHDLFRMYDWDGSGGLDWQEYLQLNNDLDNPPPLSTAQKIGIIFGAVFWGLLCLFGCWHKCCSHADCCCSYRSSYRSTAWSSTAAAATTAGTAGPPPPAPGALPGNTGRTIGVTTLSRAAGRAVQVELPPAASSDVEKGLCASASTEV
ncbi:hypothetical protein ABPG75_008236 [Micractinium tetrahymenae]